MKLLVCANLSSSHTADWLRQLSGTGWSVHAFHADYRDSPAGTRLPHPALAVDAVYLPQDANYPEPPGKDRDMERPYAIHRYPYRDNVTYLADLIGTFNPNVLHSLAFNVNWWNLGRVVEEALTRLGSGCDVPWLYSSWGTDLDFFPHRVPAIRPELERQLRRCTHHLPECARDASLARMFGFRGETLETLPAFGGLDWQAYRARRAPGPSSQRRTIVLKGRDHEGDDGDPVGRAMTAMQAFALCADRLAGYRIVVSRPTARVAEAAATLCAHHGLAIEASDLPFQTVLDTIGQARVLMALTVNDGLPRILVEAMALGALPIHSDLSPIAEWVRNGENGLLIPAENVERTAAALVRALSDDALIDAAARVNEALIQERLTDQVVRPKVLALYEHVAGARRRRTD